MAQIIIFSVILLAAILFVAWSIKKSPKKASLSQNNPFRKMSRAMIGILMLQFFVGLTVNLWITLPSSHPGTKASNYFVGVSQGVNWAITGSKIILLIVHVIVALLLIALTIVFTATAIIKQNRYWIKVFALNGLFILAAFFNGASFLNYGEQVSSLLMEVFFVLALSTQMVAIYSTKPTTSKSIVS